MSREQEGLQLLGKKTEYKMDYAPEVLETFQRSLHRSVRLLVSLISQRSRSCTYRESEWWRARV